MLKRYCCMSLSANSRAVLHSFSLVLLDASESNFCTFPMIDAMFSFDIGILFFLCVYVYLWGMFILHCTDYKHRCRKDKHYINLHYTYDPSSFPTTASFSSCLST